MYTFNYNKPQFWACISVSILFQVPSAKSVMEQPKAQNLDDIDDACDFLLFLWRCLLNVLHMQTNERVLPKRHVYLIYDVRHHFQNHTPLQFQSCQWLHWQYDGEIDFVHDFVIDVFWLQFRKDDERCRRCKFWMVCTRGKTHQRSFESWCLKP